MITDALGGRAYYMGRLELEFPVSSGAQEPRPAAVGVYRRRLAVEASRQPILTDVVNVLHAQDGDDRLDR